MRMIMIRNNYVNTLVNQALNIQDTEENGYKLEDSVLLTNNYSQFISVKGVNCIVGKIVVDKEEKILANANHSHYHF